MFHVTYNPNDLRQVRIKTHNTRPLFNVDFAEGAEVVVNHTFKDLLSLAANDDNRRLISKLEVGDTAEVEIAYSVFLPIRVHALRVK